MIIIGHNAPQCYASARSYYEMAADANYAPAVNSLGIIYRDGRGASIDSAKAMEMFSRAAQLGCVDAVHNLAAMQMARGESAAEVGYAIELLQMAANAGVPRTLSRSIAFLTKFGQIMRRRPRRL